MCIIASLLPAFVVWLALHRFSSLAAVLEQYLSAGRAFTPLSQFVADSLQFWPYIVFAGWLLLIPAMFGRPWSRGLRVVLIWSYPVVGVLLHILAMECVFHPSIRTVEVWHKSQTGGRQQPPGAYSSGAADVPTGKAQE